MAVCAAGHDSATDDYCDTCGLAIAGADGTEAPPPPGEPSGPPGAAEPSGSTRSAPSGPSSAEPSAAESSGAEAVATCPACDEPSPGRFCESCGYDIASGRAPARTVSLTLTADRDHWERMVGSGEPAFPSVPPTLTFQLAGEHASLGRVRTGGRAEVDLAITGAATDPAVSHRQCEFERRKDGAWVVRDSGSANGTWINDADEPLAAGQTHTLREGDRIRIGAWTCLTVHLS